MTIAGEPFNKIEEYYAEADPLFKQLQEVLHKYGIHYVFSACLAENHPMDGQDMIAFASNTGQPDKCEYNSQRIVQLLMLSQGQGMFIPGSPELLKGVFVPKVVPKNSRSN